MNYKFVAADSREVFSSGKSMDIDAIRRDGVGNDLVDGSTATKTIADPDVSLGRVAIVAHGNLDGLGISQIARGTGREQGLWPHVIGVAADAGHHGFGAPGTVGFHVFAHEPKIGAIGRIDRHGGVIAPTRAALGAEPFGKLIFVDGHFPQRVIGQPARITQGEILVGAASRVGHEDVAVVVHRNSSGEAVMPILRGKSAFLI